MKKAGLSLLLILCLAANSVAQEMRPPQGTYKMATAVDSMLSWNCYPTYSTYVALMDSFQHRYPQFCKIDTILSATPNGHAILAAHLTSNVAQDNDRPQFLYTSTMHGDEVVGYYCMLRLIDFLLSNYEIDEAANWILQNVDLWICPNENPDGTYYSGDDKLGNSPTSRRYNAHSQDLNRSYPGPYTTVLNYEPEVKAMMDFADSHRFTMAANLHGGSELVNYPWDSWNSDEKRHADDAWWAYVSRNYADSAQHYGANDYFTDEDEGVTNGGDWYVVTGSRQDYMNYFKHCRELTVELSSNKAPGSNNVDKYWQANKSSFLNYIKEVKNGFYGSVYDAVTLQPIAGAKIWVNGHDSLNSEAYSFAGNTNYYRPIRGGFYEVVFSAENYCPDTVQITTFDGTGVMLDVALSPYPCQAIDIPGPIDTVPTPPVDTLDVVAAEILPSIKLYPNPTQAEVVVTLPENSNGTVFYQWLDVFGKVLGEGILRKNEEKLSMSSYPSGVYFLKMKQKTYTTTLKIVKY